MSSLGIRIEVAGCTTCPFFARNVASIVADYLTKAPKKSGICNHGADGRPFPIGRLFIADEEVLPERCPLRPGPTVVTLVQGT